MSKNKYKKRGVIPCHERLCMRRRLLKRTEVYLKLNIYYFNLIEMHPYLWEGGGRDRWRGCTGYCANIIFADNLDS
jgi:hypothetical protein